MRAIFTRFPRSWPGLILIPVVIATAQGQNENEAGWQLLNAYFDDLVTLTAEFEQTLLDDAGEIVQVSGGTLAIQRPGRFRWDYAEPYEQLIVSDGDHVWLYDADLEQVTVRALDETLANTPAMLLSGDDALSDRFEIVESLRRDDSDWIMMVPRDADTDFRSVVLQFDELGLASMKLEDTLDQVTRIRFSEVKRNPEVDPARFDFEPPEGVDVIGDDGIEAAGEVVEDGP